MLVWIFLGLLVGLMIGLVGVVVALVARIRSLTSLLEDSENDNRRLGHSLEVTQKSMIQQLINMRRDGFETIPQDEPFETYRINPEQEAELEEYRNLSLEGEA